MRIPIARLHEMVARGILGFMYPPRCQACGSSLGLLSGKVLCKKCFEGIMLNTSSPPCGTSKYHFDALHSACIYEGILKDCLHNFKYRGKRAIEALFKDIMVEFAEKHMDMRRFDYFIPVPLHRVKYEERAFNQSEALAAHLSRRFEVPVLNNNLVRERTGKAQVMLSKSRRLKEIAGAFRIKNPYMIKGKVILLIDDVFTTGATANECSKIIKKAGADSVEAFTLARSMQL